MITKFDSSYVGTVDMENCGYLGTPINERHYSNEVPDVRLNVAGMIPGKLRGSPGLSGQIRRQ